MFIKLMFVLENICTPTLKRQEHLEKHGEKAKEERKKGKNNIRGNIVNLMLILLEIVRTRLIYYYITTN